MIRRPTLPLRLNGLCCLLFVLGCAPRTSGRTAALKRPVLGRQLAAELRSGAVDRPSCAVVVVAAGECPYSRALSRQWTADLRMVADSAGVTPLVRWYVFTAPGNDSVAGSVRAQGVRVLVRPGGIAEAQDAAGMLGTPQTFIVDRAEIVRAVYSGNLLPTARVLALACQTK